MATKKPDPQLGERQEREIPPGVKLMRTLESHSDKIFSLAFDRSGKMLASAGNDKVVKLWEVLSGQLSRTFNAHKGSVYSVAFDPSGRMLADGGDSTSVKLWELSSGELIRTLGGHESYVFGVEFDSTGRLLASGSRDHTIKLWDVASGNELHTLRGHEGTVYCVAFQPAGKTLASGSDDGTIKLWASATGTLLHTLNGDADYLSVAFDPAGRTLASGGGNQTVELWEVESGELLQALAGHTGNVNGVTFSSDGRLLASKSDDGTLRLWNCETWETVAVIPERIDSDRFSGLAFHPTLPLLASVGSRPGAPENDLSTLVHFWELNLDVLLGQALNAPTPAISSGGGKTGLGGTPDPAPVQDIAEASLEPFELDRESFFRRLSASSRRALYHAAGMGRYFTDRVVSDLRESKEISQPDGDLLQRTSPELQLAYLVAGLFENEDGPTRTVFLNKNIDEARFAMLVEEAKDVPLPSRTEYSPVKLDKLPDLQPETIRALQAARDIADTMGAAQIQSRHLLYGALSINDSKLVTLLAQAGVRQEDVPLTEVVAEASFPLQTIARLNSDNAEGDDLLGIDADVKALAAVIAVRDVATPLSIGLFGDWGSGKSFFMGKLRKRIFDLRDMARAAEGKSAYCDNVVQIEFNAWSYQEGDLWASLVTDIFESLAQSIDNDAGLSRETERATAKARLLASMASAGDVLADQEQKRDAAEKELQAGEQQFEALKKIGPKDVIREAYRVAAAEPEVKKGLDAAADQLNIPEAERALGDLKVELLEIKHLWSAIPLAFKGWNRPRDWIIALVVMAAVALITFVGVPVVLHYQLDSKIASLVALLSLGVGRLAPVIKKARSVTATIKGIRDSQQQRIETQQEQMRKKLADAQLRVQHATENLQNLEQGLQEMRADTQLLNFVRQRRLSTDYTSRLGTVARARRDFKQLSDLMDQARLEHQGQATQNDKKEVALALPRIDRIVLYIDDLDRCSEDKVVKVLEAVHLLLAFKLFVVIVAVDSRWLLHSLRQHSAAFRASNKGSAGISDEEDAHWESTPLNYLEKIFQIPFYLRPMRERGFNRLVHSVIGEVLSESVDDHLEKSPEKSAEGPAIEDAPEQQLQQAIQGGKAGVAPDPTPETASSGHPAKTEEVAGAISVGTNEAFSATPKDGSSDKVDADTQGADIQAQAEALKALPKEQKPNGAAAEANPAALQLREWERYFMKKLHPLIMSPRSAKRFINIYRLMRVSITNERDLAAFVGNKQGGQHRAALLLLAILTGYPAEATDILRDLLEEERPETWWQYIDGIEARWTDPAKDSSGSGSLSTQRRRDLMAKLRLLRGEIHENQSCDQFVKWASKVARYSFESGRVLALTNDETDSD